MWLTTLWPNPLRPVAMPQDFGLLVDIDEFMQQTDGAPDSLDYARFKELLAR